MLLPELRSLLQRCKNVKQTKEIHAHLLTNGLINNNNLFLTHLLTACNSTYNTDYAKLIFNQLENPDVFSWNCMIRGFSQHGLFKDAISLYIQMRKRDLQPNTFTLSAVLKSCARIPAKVAGQGIHSQVQKLGFEHDGYVETALVDMYAKFGNLESARQLFDKMPERNVVSWNSILAGHLRCGQLMAARKVFDEIPVKDVVSWNSMVSGYAKAGDMGSASLFFDKMTQKNAASWNGMITGYVDCGNIQAARQLFDEMPERSNVSWITMIAGYSKRGDVDSARQLFDQMDEKDRASWNAMIACYAQNWRPKEALQLFNCMQKFDLKSHPDEMTFASVISACSQLGDLRFGQWIENYIAKIGIDLDDHLGTALVDLYAKCGSMDKAYKHFLGLGKRDLVSYSAMILGCGINGLADDAIKLFKEMVELKINPNQITYIGLLTAYNHAGLVGEGWQCFCSMRSEHGVEPCADHFAIMVDLLGRAGRLEEAYGLIRSMPMKPQVSVWGALLLACRLHCNVELGEIAAKHCFELEPGESGYYVLLSNIYASAERWADAKRLRMVIEEKGLPKVPGCSWMDSA